ncbi:MAG: M50 family metallopeptidase [Verrucomicrobiota bacterium]|nr:M50 family metallopeptidase [Verrucomicrobiota bacterium]
MAGAEKPCHGVTENTEVSNPSAALYPPAVVKWLKFIAAVLLLPVCAGASLALWQVLRDSGGADTTWIPFLGGGACWCVIFALLPKPMWIYVFGHELTHALWTWLFGGKVRSIKVTSNGGHVTVTKTNFLITLAPYFFPLYAVLVVAVFAAGHWIWNWPDYLVYFHLLIGAAYAFHLTLTFHILQTRQTDVTSQGWLFSAVIIFLGNAAVLLLGVPLLTGRVELARAIGLFCHDTIGIFLWLEKRF